MHRGHHHPHSDMKGFLTFLVLWIIREESKTGSEISEELERRKGSRPSPGTIYPVLKYLKERGLVTVDENKSYSLTKKGEKALDKNIQHFFKTFHDIDEMRKCCPRR